MLFPSSMHALTNQSLLYVRMPVNRGTGLDSFHCIRIDGYVVFMQ